MPKNKMHIRLNIEAITMVAVIFLAFCVNIAYSSFETSVVSTNDNRTTKMLQSNGTINRVVYLGAWLDENIPEIHHNWQEVTGKGLAIYATFAALAPEVPVPNNGSYQQTLTTRLIEAIPFLRQGIYDAVCVTWMTAFNTLITDAGPDGTAFECTKKVANGSYDDIIRENAIWIKNNFHYPLILRVNHEFDVPSVWAWGTNTQIYTDAWKRIVNIFRSENIQNVKWLWSPNFNSESNVRFVDYYPGDDYVDIIGITLYANNWGWSDPTEMLNAKGVNNQNPVCPYQFALNHQKPFAITEWGLNISAGMTNEQNAIWLCKFFEMIEDNFNIRMIIHWGGYEWLLLKNPEAVEIYKTFIADQMYYSTYP